MAQLAIDPTDHALVPSPWRGGLRSLAGVMALLAVALLVATVALAASLVRATPADAAPITPVTVVSEVAGTSQGTNSSGGGSTANEDRKIWAVVAGLVAIAMALSALTVRYWRQTRPDRRSPEPRYGRREREAELVAATAAQSSEPASSDDLFNTSELFIGGFDGDPDVPDDITPKADEPIQTNAVTQTDAPPPGTNRPTRDQRAAALGEQSGRSKPN